MPGGHIATKTKAGRPETATAKVLFFDIECTPLLAWAWDRWEVNLIEVIEEKKIISFAWRWLGEKETHVLALPDFPGFKKDKKDNRALVMRLHELISEADIIVAHNAPFDDRMSRTDFIVHGLKPPPPHKQIDTLRVARSIFKFSSNKLDDLGLRLGLGRKKQTGGFALWKGCMAGDLKSYAKMRAYNKKDVILLHDIFLKLRPWMTNHPAIKPREDTNKNPPCPQCDKRRLQSRGSSITRKGRVPRVQCGACGFWPQLAWIKKAWVIK